MSLLNNLLFHRGIPVQKVVLGDKRNKNYTYISILEKEGADFYITKKDLMGKIEVYKDHLMIPFKKWNITYDVSVKTNQVDSSLKKINNLLSV